MFLNIYHVLYIIMRRYIILFLLLFFFNCSTKYTIIGVKQSLSLNEKTVTYSIAALSRPSSDPPYIVLKAVEIVRVKENYREQVKVEKSIIPLTFVPLLGIIPGFGFITRGYVAFGKDLIGLSLLTEATIVGGILLTSNKIGWRSQREERIEKRIPSEKKFILSLVGEDCSNVYLPDKEGILRINVADFAPFYKEDKNLEFHLVTPNQDSIDLFIPADKFAPLGLKKKESGNIGKEN